MQILNRLYIRQYSICLFLIVSALLIAFATIIYRHYENAQKISDWTFHNYEVSRHSRKILMDLVDMETGVRGYLLTGKAVFLEPFHASKRSIVDYAKQLRELTKNEPLTEKNVGDWLTKIEVFSDLLNQQVEAAYKKGLTGISQEMLAAQKKQMDDLRTLIEDQISKRIDQINVQMEKSKTQQKRFRLTIIAGTTLTIGGMLLAIAMINSLVNRNARSVSEVHEAEGRLMTVMEGVNDGLYDFNLTDNVIYYSPTFKSMLGYEYDDFPNTVEAFNELLHPEDHAATWETFSKYQSGQTKRYSNIFRMRHKGERWVWILSRGVGLKDKSGKMVRLMGTHSDITEHKRREEVLQQLNAEMETFIFITSHDLRSPLVNLKGFANEMQDAVNRMAPVLKKLEPHLSDEEKTSFQQSFEEDIPESLRFIERAVEKMDLLTSAVLDLSRIGKRMYRIEMVDANAVAQRCIDAMSYEINHKGIQLICDTLPTLYTDQFSLEQVFSNVLDNAVKYLDPARPGTIHISAKQANSEIIFSVADNGRGIDEADKEKVFQFFRRARNTSDIRGQGMGMTFVQTTLRKLGGEIWFDSKVGKGSVFYFKLPKFYSISDSSIEQA